MGLSELSEWLQVMLAEIERREDELKRERAEAELRAREVAADDK